MKNRETPKALVKRGNGVEFPFSCYCLSCLEFIGYNEKMKYCKFCGQRVTRQKAEESK